MPPKLNDKKTIFGWAIFDWANSAYALVVSTAVFPPFFSSLAPEKMDVFGQQIDNTSVYSFSVAFAYLLVALFTPFLSGIADYGGRRASFLKFFTLLGSLSFISFGFLIFLKIIRKFSLLFQENTSQILDGVHCI